PKGGGLTRRMGRAAQKRGGLVWTWDLTLETQMRITWQRLNRCGCIPRIAKVVEPFAIARVRDGDMLADVGRLVCFRWVSQLLPIERTAMTCTHFAKEQVLFREGDPADRVFRL